MKNIKNTLSGLPDPIIYSDHGTEDNPKSHLFFENLEWFTTAEAAVYLRKISPSGSPQLNTVHQMVSRGLIKRRKFGGRLYFKRRELDYLIESGANFSQGR